MTPSAYIVCRYCNGKDVELRLQIKTSMKPKGPALGRGFKPVGFDLMLRWARDSACGIYHLHSLQPPICHRDIATRNLLLHDDKVKLADFGASLCL
jgi:serine/threonine protein kinase